MLCTLTLLVQVQGLQALQPLKVVYDQCTADVPAVQEKIREMEQKYEDLRSQVNVQRIWWFAVQFDEVQGCFVR